MNITASTKVMAVIGHPIEHSLSPAIHNFLLQKYNINCVYTALDIKEENLENTVKFLREIKSPGFNVTMPHKQNIIKYLDELSQEAQLIGAVNTVALKDNRLIGYNTDALGFTQSIKDKNIYIEGKSFAFFGAGGAVRAAAFQCALEGADQITIVNRDEVKARNLAMEISTKFNNVKVRWRNLYEFATRQEDNGYDIIVNGTSLGMYPHVENSIIDTKDFFIEGKIAFDMVYNPRYTKFLKSAQQSKMTTIPGIDMLLTQGILAFKIWFDVEEDAKDIKSVIESQNLILLD